MTIQIDSREKTKAIKKILLSFDAHGIDYFVSKLPVADYMCFDNPRLVIDRKQNLLEICSNVCQQHKRFTDELKRAQQYGIKVVILCEHGVGINTLDDVMRWKNPRLKKSPLAMSGERLYRIMSTMQKTYGVEWQFCDKNHTGQRIIEILGGGSDG